MAGAEDTGKVCPPNTSITSVEVILVDVRVLRYADDEERTITSLVGEGPKANVKGGTLLWQRE
jgi:hypothetical protein